mgnify:CR=1 FL=1
MGRDGGRARQDFDDLARAPDRAAGQRRRAVRTVVEGMDLLRRGPDAPRLAIGGLQGSQQRPDPLLHRRQRRLLRGQFRAQPRLLPLQLRDLLALTQHQGHELFTAGAVQVERGLHRVSLSYLLTSEQIPVVNRTADASKSPWGARIRKDDWAWSRVHGV